MNPQEAFEEAAAAMFEIMLDGTGLETSKAADVSCMGDALEDLLVEFLNALISSSDIEDIAFLEVDIGSMVYGKKGWTLAATAKGVARGEAAERFLTEVKAATYCGVSVAEVGKGRWEAQCVVDL